MRIPLLGLTAALFIALIAVPTAHAARVPCVVGQKAPKCKVWTAKVKFAADGDTFRPQIKEGKKWSPKKTVRMTGIQAPELSSYSRAHGRKGNCLGVEAAEELEKLIKRRTVRLVAMKGGSSTEGGRSRLRRTVQVKKGGRWIDPAMVLLEKGLVIWDPDGEEWAWNGVYSRLAQQAAARRVGLWNPVACGKPGPSQDTPLTMKLKWDGEGRDTANSEWVRIKNGDPLNPVSLAGWRLRDAASRAKGGKGQSAYKFPAGAVIPPGGSITVRVGRGPNGDGVFHWGLAKPVFQNASNDKKQVGDGAYLFDPHLEMRAHVQYPCRTECFEPLAGKVSVEARYTGATYEWTTVTNTSSETIWLNEYEMESVPWFYEFGPGDVLAPGQALVLFNNKPPSLAPLTKASDGLVAAVPGSAPFVGVSFFRSWGHTKPLFGDRDDTVTLRNPFGAPVACHAWGGEKCPTV